MSRKAPAKAPPTSTGKVPDLQNFVQDALAPIAWFGIAAAAIIGAITNLTAIEKLNEERPLLVGAITAATVLLVAWALIERYIKKNGRNWLLAARILAVAIICCAYSLIVIYPRVCLLTNFCGEAQYRPFQHLNFLTSPAYALDKPPLEILQVSVDDARSSFLMTKDDESIHAGREPVLRTALRFDREMMGIFKSASCRGVSGEAPIEDALAVWRLLLKDRGRNDLVQQLSGYDGYRDLIQHGGNRAFLDARPTKAELVDLLRKKPEWYSLLFRWMVECVGVADPVLIWTLHNNADKPLTVTAVEYEVSDVGQVMGGGPDTLEPIDVSPHDLLHAKGTQTRTIFPQIILQPGTTKAIRIYYRLEATNWGFTWRLSPVFRTLEGPSATGPELKIFSAKNPTAGHRQ